MVIDSLHLEQSNNFAGVGEQEPELVTVVIPARDEEDFIEACVRSISSQTYEALQIIVVDGASQDRTKEIVRDLAEDDPRIELLENPASIIPVSLNIAVAAARGRWLVRVDAHSTVPPSYVAQCVVHLASDKWGGVGGRKDGIGITPQGRAIAVAMGSKFGVGNSTYHHGTDVQVVEHIPFGAYPVDVIREVGGWDEELRVNQDFEFDHRVRETGYELLFDPALRIDWHCRQSLGDLWRQYERYGEGKTHIFRLHPKSIKPRQVAPAILVPALSVAAMLLLVRPKVSAIIAGPYGAFLLMGTLREQGKLEDVREKALLPGAFAAMHVGFSKGLLRGAFKQFRQGRA